MAFSWQLFDSLDSTHILRQVPAQDATRSGVQCRSFEGLDAGPKDVGTVIVCSACLQDNIFTERMCFTLCVCCT